MLELQWLAVPLLMLIAAIFYYRQQQRLQANYEATIQTLHEDNAAQKQLIDTQMQDLTAQMVNHATLDERIHQSEKQVLILEAKLTEKDEVIHALQEDAIAHEAETGRLETRLSEERKATVEKLALLDEAKHTMSREFQLLAQKIFDEKGKTIQEENRRGLDEVLQPMREQLGAFRQRVDDIHTHETKERATLNEHLNQLKKLNLKMSEDALNLTQALKGESKLQGNWGEMILERILEASGLREGKEFAREQSFVDEDGKRRRPDVVIYMPGNKQVIIDSKVSLTDYERTVSARDETEKKIALSAHLRSLKSHIQELSSKRYDHLPNVHSPDYVLMFLPIEGAYLMAIEADSTIFEAAFEKRVAVVTPSTLYATLKLIEQLWRYEQQNEHVARLIAQAAKLHDKMVDFVKAFEDVGQRLNQAQVSYDLANGRMLSGRGNVIRQIAQLKELAGKTKKELPEHLLEKVGVSTYSEDEVNHEH